MSEFQKSAALICLLTLLASIAVNAAGAVEDVDNLLHRERQRISREAAAVLAAPLPADAIDVIRSSGVPADGSADAAGPLNAAIQAANGRPLYLPPGVYLLQKSLAPISGTRLFLAADAEMRRGFDGGNGDVNGALVQGDRSFKTNGVQIVGGRWTSPGNKLSGRVFNAIGRGWTIDSAVVESWGAGGGSICAAVSGDEMTIRRSSFTGAPGNLGQAGIRITCGEKIRVVDCYIESGDDTFCAFPPETARQLAAGRPIRDVEFLRCFGWSAKARFAACGLTAVNALRKHDITVDALNAVAVSDIRFVECAGSSKATGGHAPAFFVICANSNQGAAVSNVTFDRCVSVAGPAADQAVKIVASEGASCTRVALDRCKVIGGQKEGVTIASQCREIVVRDCDVNGRLTNERH